MTKGKRIINILQSLAMIFFAFVMIAFKDASLSLITAIIGTGLLYRGFGSLIYYFRMSRFMVGGKLSLYRGMIFLDLGLFTASLSEAGSVYIIFYISVLNLFAGAVAVFRASDSKKLGSSKWLYKAAYGTALMSLSVIVLIGEFIWHNRDIAVYTYCAGIMISAIRMFTDAFKKTAIPYIP